MSVRGRCVVFVAGSIALTLVACAAASDPSTSEDEIVQPTRRSTPESDAGTKVTKGTDASTNEDAAPPPATCVTAPPNNRCGLSPQCGCATNETCDVTNEETGAASCIAAGSATMGRPCAGTSECGAGLICLYGACRPYCSTAKAQCATAGTGLCVAHENDQGPVPNMNVCMIACDPRNPAAVCGANSCVWFPTYYAPEKVSDCNFPGPRALGQTCIDELDCQPGLGCVPDSKRGNGKYCERWCRIGVAGDCTGNTTCRDVFGANAPVIEGQKEGICQ